MRNLFLVLTLILSLTLITEAKEVQGTIIYNDNSTEKVTFSLKTGMGKIVYNSLQQGIKYIDKKGERQQLSPDDAKEISFTYKNREIRMLSIPYIMKKKKRFIRLDVDGKLKLLSYIRSDSFLQYILTEEGDFFLAPSASIKKVARENFQDCPDLIKEVNSKAIKYMNDLVVFYNQKCG